VRVRVERLIGGWFSAPAGIFRRGDDMHRTIRYPVPAYLLETATERILVDTGLDPDAIADPGAYYERPDIFAAIGLAQERSIPEQVDLDALTRVVLTHLHWDHAGALRLVPPHLPIVVQRAEWEARNDPDAIARNSYLPRDYAGDDRTVVVVEGDHDLLGDGSIELLHTPGHTPGHQSLRIGDLVLAADVIHFASGLDDHRFPVFADDHRRQARSAVRLGELRDRGATVVPGHDPEVLQPGRVTAARRGGRPRTGDAADAWAPRP
jgi:glyoxylase-like metal-dependent hydrolase (beta-lactamase superfamily II)